MMFISCNWPVALECFFFFLVSKQTISQFQQVLQQWKHNMFSQKYWLTQMAASSRSSQKSHIIGSDSTENQDYDDEWVSKKYMVIIIIIIIIIINMHMLGEKKLSI